MKHVGQHKLPTQYKTGSDIRCSVLLKAHIVKS